MKRIILRWAPFLFTLLIFSTFFYLVRLFMGDFDEHDHIAAGYLMKQGKLLYKDIFTHHFPLPYYWTWFFTPLWSDMNPSRTISIFRLSLLAYYLIIFTLSYITMRSIKTRIVFLVWIIFVGCCMVLYEGNIILSDTFSSIALMGLFWSSFPIVLGWEKASKTHVISQVMLASLGLWAQPMVALLLIIPIVLVESKYRKNVVILIAILNAIPLIIFAFTQQLTSFFEQALWFNSAIYSKYYAEHLPQGNSFFSVMWYFLINEWKLLTTFGNPLQIFQGITHVGLLGLLIYCFKTNKVSCGLLITLFIFSTRLRELKIVTGVPFVYGIYSLILLGVAATLILIVQIYKNNKVMPVVVSIFLLVLAYIPIAGIVEKSLDREYNYHVFWSYRQERGEILKKLSEPHEKILVYPHDVDMYYFANRQPIDRFLYWFPWTNDVPKYRKERLDALKNTPPPVIDLNSLAFKKDQRYKEYFPTLVKGYIPVKKDGKATGVYLRADLKERLERL